MPIISNKSNLKHAKHLTLQERRARPSQISPQEPVEHIQVSGLFFVEMRYGFRTVMNQKREEIGQLRKHILHHMAGTRHDVRPGIFVVIDEIDIVLGLDHKKRVFSTSYSLRSIPILPLP